MDVDKIKNIVECPICLELAFDAVMTSCGHLLCGECQEQCITVCPSCREPIKSHSPNYAIRDMIRLVYPHEYSQYEQDREKKQTIHEFDEETIIQYEHIIQQATVEYYNHSDKKLLELVKPLANQGYPVAEWYMGKIFSEGKGVNMDQNMAEKWYLRAYTHAKEYASYGLAFGQYALGICYNSGTGVEKDDKKAVEWYLCATESNVANVAMNNLGVCYELGTGVEKDEKQAVEWYHMAAAKGNASAQFNLGYCYMDGIGVEKDEKQAAEWYHKAAQKVMLGPGIYFQC